MPRRIPITVDTHLRVDGNLLGADIVEQILDELTIPNVNKIDAKRRDQYKWWEIADEFLMADLDGDELVMARGYAFQLKLLLREHGLEPAWIDCRRYRRGTPIGKDEFSYRSHQPDAVRAIRHHQQLIYKAPTGSGKTVTILGAIWEMCPRRSLILVDRINLVDQWADRTVEHIGISREEIGLIGDGKWSEGRITIATVQTLIRNIDRLRESGWFRKWDFVCLDECHHVTAETYLTIMQEFPARIRMGTSATPDKTGVFDMALNALGEVAYETTQEELREAGILVVPTVEVVPTSFAFTYWGDHKATKKGDCSKPGCRNTEPYHRHRNNYANLKKELINDVNRNVTIVNEIIKYRDRVQLVITDQTTHIDVLEKEVNAALIGVPVYVLTGKQTRKMRQEIIAQIEDSEEPCIILSTIAGEALDIAIISVIHLPWPTRNPRKTEQNVGRGTRVHVSKDGVIVLDYVDRLVDVLSNQFRSRRWKCYEPLGFNVVNDTTGNIVDEPRRKKGLMSLGGAR